MADIKTIQLIVNSEQAKSKIAELNKQLDVAKQKKLDAFRMGDAKGVEVYSKEIKKLERQLTKAQTRGETITKTLKGLDKATPNELKRTIRELTKELNSGKIERGTKEWDVLNEALSECNGELKKIKEESKAVAEIQEKSGNILTKWGDKWVGLIGSIQMGWEVLDKVRNIMGEYVSAYLDMAEAESQVTKYTGMTAEEVKELNEEFKKMDTRTSREQLNALAGDAGRLGITGKQGVLDFVEAADMINVALGEDLGEDAVKNIGKLAQLFGDDDKMGLKQAMISTGSVINHLGSISSASESYIVDFTGRLSSMAATAKMSQADVMGLAAVLDQGMVASEQASTALSSIIQKLHKDTSGMASAVGLNVQEFATLLKTDANEALMTWLDAVNKMGGMDVIAPLLGDLKLAGAGVSKTIATLAGNIDQVRSTQEEANKAFQEGTSILSEVEKANSTPLAQQEKLQEQLHNLKVQLGEELYPTWQAGMGMTSQMVSLLSTLISFLGQYGKQILAVTALLSSYKIAVVASTVATKAWGVVTGVAKAAQAAWHAVIGAGRVAIIAYTYGMRGATMATKAFTAATKANPWGLLLTVVTTAVGAIWSFVAGTEEAAEKTKDLEELQKNAVAGYAAEEEKLKRLTSILDSNTESYDNKKKALEALKSIVKDYHGDLTTEGKLINDNRDAIDKYITSLKNQSIAKAVSAMMDEKAVELAKAQLKLKKKKFNLAAVDKELQKEMYQPKMVEVHIPEGEGFYEETYMQDAHAGVRNAKLRERAIQEEAVTEAQKDVDRIEREIKEIENWAKQQGGVFEAIFDSYITEGNTPPITPTTTSSATTDPKAEAAKKLKETMEMEKAQAELRLRTGLSTQAEYDEAMLTAEQNYFNGMKSIYGSETKELIDAELGYHEAVKKHRMTFHDWSMKDLERQEREEQENALANYAHGTIGEEEYRKEMERIQVHYLRRRANMAKQYGDEEGAAKLNAQAEEAELSNQLNRRKKFEEEAVRMNQEYMKQSTAARKQAELNLLKELVAQGLIPKDKLDEYTAEIEKKFQDAATEVGGQMDPISSSVVGMMTALDNLSDKIKDGKAQWQDYAAAGVAALSMVTAIMSSASQLMQANYQAEEAALNKRYDADIEAAGKGTKRAQQLEEEKQRKLAELKTEAAKKAMPLEIAQATASTAMAAINAYASASKISPILGPIAAAAAVAAGALQIATIKKQHEAQMAGYYDGGFTGGNSYRRTAGVVHEGEFVANHNAVNNPNVLPVLKMLDYAQRNNTIASVSSADIAHAAGGANGQSAVAPVVIHETSRTSEALERLNEHLTAGIRASVSITGEDGFERQWDKFNRMKRNAH